MKYLLFIFIFSLFSCGNINPPTEREEVSLLQKADTNLYTGKIIEYYTEVNQKKFEKIYQKGIKNGGYISWYKNGKIKIIGNYCKDKRVGLWQWYKENGDLEYQFKYQS